MKKILLRNNGVYVLVDDEDYLKYSYLKWYMNNSGYAVRRDSVNEGKIKKTTYLHRLIANTPTNLFVDHINRNRLDNRKENLRNVTWEENRNNISVHKDNKNGEKNVDYNKKLKKFRVRIQRNKQVVFYKYYKNLLSAIQARDLLLKNERIMPIS